MAIRKSKTKKPPLVMRADDIMPWGKCTGKSIRTIYFSEPDYFEYLLNSCEYLIPEKTLDILRNGLDIIDRTSPSFSRGARLNKTEYKENDVVWEKDGVQVTLIQLFMTNEAYYRSLVDNPKFFISQRTFESMMIKKYGPESVKHHTREEISQQIIDSINGFEFTEDDVYTDKDLSTYIGDRVDTVFTSELNRIIKHDQVEGRFHLREDLQSIYTFDYKYHCYDISPIFLKAIKNPDKSRWESYCGKYETNCKDFKLKKVWMKDGDLYGLDSNEVRRNFKFKFYPIGDSTFGRRDGDAIVTFGDGFCIIDNITCQKL